jgi:hypothetical protein
MKKAILIFLVLIFCSVNTGCGTARLTTKIGGEIGQTYQEAASEGKVTAEESIGSWNYISGLIKGLFADNYELDMPSSAKNIIDALDKIAAKEELSDEDKGRIIGYFCRLEAMAIAEGWDKYGVSITKAIKGVLL